MGVNRSGIAAVVLLAAAAPMAAAQGQDFFQGEALSELQRFRAYPHVDRGLQEYDKKHYRAAAESFARALEIVPASARIRLALVRALAGDSRLEEAERQLRPLAGQGAEADSILFNLRSLRLQKAPPLAAETLAGWLKDCPPDWCERYATLGAGYLANKGRKDAARELLAAYRTRRGAEAPSRPMLLLEAGIAEAGRDWSAARRTIEAAAAQAPLNAAEKFRYGTALLGDGDFDGVSRLLEEPWAQGPDGLRLTRELIQRAIAARHPDIALEHFTRLESRVALTPEERNQRLILAGEAGRTDILEKIRPVSENGRQLRLRLLAERYQKEGQYKRIIELLAPAAPDRPLTLSLAQAYERSGDLLAAAAQMTTAFRRWHQWEDLDRASYLFLLAGAPEKAKRLLQPALPYPRDTLGSALHQRLLDLYQAAPAQADEDALATLGRQKLTALQTDALAEIWRLKGRCDRSVSLLENGQPGGQGLLVLADCHRQKHPGLALHYFEQAEAYAPDLAARSMAYLHQATGNPAAALARWRSLPPKSLQRNDLLAAAEAALAAGELAQARRWWQAAGQPADADWHRLGARLAEKEGNRQAALEHWSEAFRQKPDGTAAYAMGALQAAQGRKNEAVISYREAFRREPEQDEIRLGLGFALVDDSPAEAATLLAESRRQGPERFPVEEQLSYLRTRLGDNDKARQHLTAAVDQADAHLAQVPPDEAADRLFALRRMRESLDRRWSVGFSTWGASGSVPGELVAGRTQLNGAPRHYAEVSGEYRLGSQPVSNYRFLALTARASVQGNSSDPYLQGQGMLALGLRWKPFSSWNLYFSAEEQHPLNGQGENDLMLRTTASFLDQGLHRGDWHAGGKGWLQQELYLDGAKWVNSGRYDVLARYTIGRNWKLPSSLAHTLFPYAFVQGERRSDGDDSRWGAGVAWRLWRNDDRYTAFRKNYTVKLERQQVIYSELARSNGWFLKLEAAW